MYGAGNLAEEASQTRASEEQRRNRTKEGFRGEGFRAEEFRAIATPSHMRFANVHEARTGSSAAHGERRQSTRASYDWHR
jgi:hypothetical protein